MENGKNLETAKVVQDESGHWYVIPSKCLDDFDEDLSHQDFIDSGQFGRKWDHYRTDGDINNKQLWANFGDKEYITEIWDENGLLSTHNIILSMSKGDAVLHDGIEYEVKYCVFDDEICLMTIHVKS